MSSTPPPAATAAPPPSPEARPAQGPPPGGSAAGALRRIAILALVLAVAGVGLWSLAGWIQYRGGHSITDDAFVEAHIVNVAPELVSGRIVRFVVEENDRVEKGQVLAEVDPVPYLDRVDLARSKVAAAEAELTRQRADLERVRKEVPIQVEIARRTLGSADADRGRAESSLGYTRDEVDTGIDEARAGLKAARADLTLSQEEYGRFTRLYQKEASTQRRAQEVTRAQEAAQAQVDLAEARLAKALASRTQVDVARRTVEAAQASRNKADKGIELAEIGYDQIREVELLVKVKEQTIEEARTSLRAAEHDLEYTKIRAPFPGVVVKRYRHLGDFASAGVAVLSLYNPDLLYVEANLEETRLPGVAPGNPVAIELDAFSRPFRGWVVWINKSTGAQFALMPRNVVYGEFTKVVQRVAVRIAIERDDRWPQLRAGLSARVVIAHGPGDPDWAAKEARRLAEVESRFNQAGADTAPSERGAK
ncbi:MAG: HlyD family secretion protein [Paludisphaera borealis]|uniref:HlyD family secretion protein n=1 Tax=Paludisphaera borealis TaxID=1387353 RepID=UPI0028460E46|nr:HlyD family secretion protein [Paludisphaera borealis]MDR3618756.1 HlyD family secretion protein [Paludisphaera borealis]